MYQAYGDQEESIFDQAMFTKYKAKYHKTIDPEVNYMDFSLEKSFESFLILDEQSLDANRGS